jgi:hypothetical protein
VRAKFNCGRFALTTHEERKTTWMPASAGMTCGFMDRLSFKNKRHTRESGCPGFFFQKAWGGEGLHKAIRQNQFVIPASRRR